MNGTPGQQKRRLRTMNDVPLDGKRVLVRVDLNVSVGSDGTISSSEDYRIEAALPTIEELMQRRCRVLLLTHLGRPQEGQDGDLAPVHHRLEELLREEVKRTKTLYGPDVNAIVSGLEPGGVVLLPNVRLDEREEQGNQQFAKQLATNAEVYVSEAFSVSHRAHTSVAFLPQELPACAGRRTMAEVAVLEKLRERPEHPYVAIASGAKIKTKIGLMYDLLGRVEKLCVGGQLANAFLAAQGKLPAERYTPDDIAAAGHLLEVGAGKLVLPVDVVVGNEADGADARVVPVDAIPPEAACVCDIGPESVTLFVETCRAAKTIMWNGPVGRFEVPAYAEGTLKLVRELAHMSAYRVIGGGDTVNALEQERLVKKYDHVSVGGGAMVAFLEGKRLPGLEPLYE